MFLLEQNTRQLESENLDMYLSKEVNLKHFCIFIEILQAQTGMTTRCRCIRFFLDGPAVKQTVCCSICACFKNYIPLTNSMNFVLRFTEHLSAVNIVVSYNDRFSMLENYLRLGILSLETVAQIPPRQFCCFIVNETVHYAIGVGFENEILLPKAASNLLFRLFVYLSFLFYHSLMTQQVK